MEEERINEDNNNNNNNNNNTNLISITIEHHKSTFLLRLFIIPILERKGKERKGKERKERR